MTTDFAPPARTSNDSSSFGIIPPEIVPSFHRLERGAGDARDPARRVLHVAQHARRGRHEHERVGAERAGELARDGVAVDVEHLPLAIAPEAREHRDVAPLEEIAEERQVEADDLPDEAEVHRVRPGALHHLGWPARRLDGVAARAVEADGHDSVREEARAEVHVELPGDDVLHHLERRGVGGAAARDHARLEAEPLLERRRLRTAAVDDRDAVPAVDENAQVLRDAVEIQRVDELTAELQHDGLHGGHGPGSASEVISSRPSMRFMSWIACPAPPFTRLSVAAKSVTVRRPARAGPATTPTSAKFDPETAATSGRRRRGTRTNGSSA